MYPQLENSTTRIAITSIKPKLHFHFQEVKFKIPKAEQRVLHEREVEQAAARKGPSPTASETSESNKIQAIYRNHHSMPWSYYEQAPMNSGGLGGLGSRPESPPNNFMNMMMGNNKPMNRKRQRPSRYVKMTQINFVSRNQLHNTANSCQHLNFGLSWPG